MHAVGRIPDQGHPLGNKAVGNGQVERIGPSLSRQFDLPQKITEPRFENLDIARVVKAMDLGRHLCGLAPDDRAAVAGQRQNRQRSGRHKELMRNAVVRSLMFDGTDQSGLTVIPAGAFYPRALCRSALATVCADQQARIQLRTVVQGDSYSVGGYRLRDDPRFFDLRNVPLAVHRFQQGMAQMPVFDHVAHWAFFDFRMIEMHPKGGWAFTGPTVRDLDFQHRLRLVHNRAPNANRIKKPLRGQCQRIGASVKRGILAGFFRKCVHNRHAKARTGQRKRHGRTIQPATNNQDVAVCLHSLQYEWRCGIVHVRSCRYRCGNS